MTSTTVEAARAILIATLGRTPTKLEMSTATTRLRNWIMRGCLPDAGFPGKGKLLCIDDSGLLTLAMFSTFADAGVHATRFHEIAAQATRDALWQDVLDGKRGISIIILLRPDTSVVSLSTKKNPTEASGSDAPYLGVNLSNLFAKVTSHLQSVAA